MAKKEVVKEEAVAQPAPTVPASEIVPKKKGNPLLIVGIIVGVVVVLGGSILGYGFWNGSQIKKFAKDSETMYAVTTDWGNAFEEDAIDKVKENVTQIKTESEKALATLNNKSVPKKAKQLKADLVEYFTISKKVATDAEGIVDWAVEIEKVSTDLSDMSSLDTSSPEAMATAIDEAKVDIDASVTKLEAMSVPASLKTQHEAFIKTLKSLSTLYGRLSVALKANDLNALTNISSEFTVASTGLDNVENPEDTISKAWDDDKTKLDNLDKSITDSIISLKNVRFSF